MAISQYLTCSTLLLILALWTDFGHSSELQLADINEKQLLDRSNSSFYGGVALWQTIVETTDTCPPGVETCGQGFGTCCPQGTYCEDNGYFCCPIDIDCSVAVKAAPACADPSWGLYEDSGGSLFCCLPDTYGLPGSGCVASNESFSATLVATSLTQAHIGATGSPSATTGTGTAATTTPGSPTTTKSSANKLISGGSLAVIAFVLILGLAV